MDAATGTKINMKTLTKLTIAAPLLALVLAVQAGAGRDIATNIRCSDTNMAAIACGGCTNDVAPLACGGDTNAVFIACGDTNLLTISARMVSSGSL